MSDNKKLTITIQELTKSESKEIQTKHLIKDLTEYNFEAIYQRGSDIWSDQMKENLIISVMCDVPAGYIHIIRHQEKSDSWYVCDGKQRMQTIKEFREGKFSIYLGDEKIYYEDLKLPKYKQYYDQFMSYSWKIIEWPAMSILKQRDLFERINAMSALTSHEKLYCSNFFTKSLLTYVYSIFKEKIKDRLPYAMKDNKRFTGLYWIHGIMHTCFDNNFLGSYNDNPPTAALKKESAQTVNQTFEYYFANKGILQEGNSEFDGNIINEEILKDINPKLLENIQLLERVVKALDHSLKFGVLLNKKDKNAISDMVVWMLNKVRDKVFTISQIEDQQEKFFNVFKKFLETRADKGYTQNQANKNQKLATLKYLDELVESLETGPAINMEPKGQSLTDLQKQEAIAKCNGYCPICNCKLENTVVHFDHVNCKSQYGTTKACCICEHCNLKKSNWTADQLDKYSNYIKLMSKD